MNLSSVWNDCPLCSSPLIYSSNIISCSRYYSHTMQNQNMTTHYSLFISYYSCDILTDESYIEYNEDYYCIKRDIHKKSLIWKYTKDGWDKVFNLNDISISLIDIQNKIGKYITLQ